MPKFGDSLFVILMLDFFYYPGIETLNPSLRYRQVELILSPYGRLEDALFDMPITGRHHYGHGTALQPLCSLELLHWEICANAGQRIEPLLHG